MSHAGKIIKYTSNYSGIVEYYMITSVDDTMVNCFDKPFSSIVTFDDVINNRNGHNGYSVVDQSKLLKILYGAEL